MVKRVPPRRVKRHRTYTTEELSTALSIHPNTVAAWRKQGLAPIDDRRPILFKGAVVTDFLAKRIAAGKAPLGPGRFYCLPCRGPKEPAGGMVEFTPDLADNGMLRAICPDCGRLLHRRVNRRRLDSVAAGLDLTIRPAE